MSVAIESRNMQPSLFNKDVPVGASNQDGGRAGAGADEKVSTACLDKGDIINPGEHDVLLGRGGGTNNHIGNKNFRQLVSEHKLRYLNANKMEKPNVAREVVTIWRKLNPPGRFLQRKDEDARGPGSVQDEGVIWVEVGEQEARKKASQCLRERTPDVKQYIAEMYERQDELTERGVALVEQKMKRANEQLGLSPDIAGSGDRRRGSGIGNMPDRPTCTNISTLRRVSMPALARSLTDSFPGKLATGKMRTQDRRTSMPAASQLQGGGRMNMEALLVRQQQILRDAYTAIKRTGDMDSTNIARLQMQQHQQLLSNQQSMMQQQQYMGIRANQHAIRSVMSGNLMHQNTNGMNNMNQMNGHAQQLVQQQEYIVREQQRLIAERERLVQQEHMLLCRQAEMARQQQLLEQQEINARLQQARPVRAVSVGQGEHDQDLNGSGTELDPLPFTNDYTIPLSEVPDVPTSAPSPLEVAARSKEDSSDSPKKRGSKAQYLDESKKRSLLEAVPKSNGDKAEKSKDEFDQSSIDPKSSLLDYRDTLEKYITNNQSSVPSLDIDEDGGGNDSGLVNGVETSDWIEQQLVHDSEDLSLSTKGRRPLQRTNSKKSLMSLASGSHHDNMSFAFSDMEQSEDLSKAEKRTASRSMSILSTNTAMSELTDFDDLDCL